MSVCTVLFNDVCNDIHIGFDNGLLTGVMYLDLKKAFDTVNHQILLYKLAQYGLSTTALSWVSNYLSSRKQCTVYKGKSSELKTVSCGVPQGSILGPLLFIIYLNDLPQVVLNSKIALYADDTVIYYQSNSVDEIRLMLQEDLSLVSNWMNVNMLSLNVDKSKTMLFSHQAHANPMRLQLEINGTELEQVSVYKYLGIYLDEKLNMEYHIEQLCAKSKKKLGMLGRIRKFISRSTATTLFKSLLLPVLEYGDIIYGTANVTTLEKVQRIQNSGMRIILMAPKRTHIRDMLGELQEI